MEAIIKRELITDKRLCRILAVGTFIVLTTLSAFVRIPLPFTPVPLTLQTFFVLLSGALLGRKLGVSTQAVYMFFRFFWPAGIYGFRQREPLSTGPYRRLYCRVCFGFFFCG